MTHNMALIQVTVMLGIFDIVDQFLILIFKIFNTLVIIYFIFIYLFIISSLFYYNKKIFMWHYQTIHRMGMLQRYLAIIFCNDSPEKTVHSGQDIGID